MPAQTTDHLHMPLPSASHTLAQDVDNIARALRIADAGIKAAQEHASAKSDAAVKSVRQLIDPLTQAVDTINAHRVASVNRKTGLHITLTPQDLGMLPASPTDGPTEGTLLRDAGGLLTGARLRLAGENVAYDLTRDKQQRLSAVTVTHQAHRRTVTVERDALGQIISFAAEKSDV